MLPLIWQRSPVQGSRREAILAGLQSALMAESSKALEALLELVEKTLVGMPLESSSFRRSCEEIDFRGHSLTDTVIEFPTNES